MSDEVGPRLQAWRAKHKLSQRQLARKAGVPSSGVSLIESGKVSPSIGSLKRLLDAMGVSLAEFFSGEVADERQIFFRADQLMEIGGGTISYRQVGRTLGNNYLQMLYETYQPGADSGRIRLTHAGEEAGIVISGSLEVTVGARCRTLGPGDAYLFNSTLPHRFRNPGGEACVLVTACTPPSF